MGHQHIRAFALFLALAACALPREGEAESRSPIVWHANATVWGGDLGVGYRGLPLFTGLDTVLWVWAGASVEDVSFYRMPDGSLITGMAPNGVDPAVDPFSWRWSGRGQLGAAQGLAWNRRTDANLLEAFAYWRARVDANLRDPAVPGQLAFLSADVNRYGTFQNAILAGLRWEDAVLDRVHKTRDGLSAESSAECSRPRRPWR